MWWCKSIGDAANEVVSLDGEANGSAKGAECHQTCLPRRSALEADGIILRTPLAFLVGSRLLEYKGY